VGDAQLASRVDGVGRETVACRVKAFPGGEARVAGGGPSAEVIDAVIEGEFAQGKEEIPEVRREGGVDGSEGGDKAR
jgi:hypothetical protein